MSKHRPWSNCHFLAPKLFSMVLAPVHQLFLFLRACMLLKLFSTPQKCHKMRPLRLVMLFVATFVWLPVLHTRDWRVKNGSKGLQYRSQAPPCLRSTSWTNRHFPWLWWCLNGGGIWVGKLNMWHGAPKDFLAPKNGVTPLTHQPPPPRNPRPLRY